ncbi:Ibr domain protein [Pelomyxa schiedti]|nr:Ibr domain protein [Pelomyxa schiedti]
MSHFESDYADDENLEATIARIAELEILEAATTRTQTEPDSADFADFPEPTQATTTSSSLSTAILNTTEPLPEIEIHFDTTDDTPPPLPPPLHRTSSLVATAPPLNQSTRRPPPPVPDEAPFDITSDVSSSEVPSEDEPLTLKEMTSRLASFKDLLNAPSTAETERALTELYENGISKLQERVTVLINQYVDSPTMLQDLMLLYEQVDVIQTQWQNRQQQGETASEVIRSSIHMVETQPLIDLPEQNSTAYITTPFSGTSSTSSSSTTSSSSAAVSTPPGTSTRSSSLLKQVQINDAEPEEPLPDISCPICMDDVKGSLCYRLRECKHQYCVNCFDDYLSTLIKDGKVLDIKCPNPTCTAVVSYHDVSVLIENDELFAKYEEFLFLAALKAEPGLRWCPKPGCGNAMIGSEDDPRMVCNKPGCGYEFCFKCNEEWHTGTCEDLQKWKLENGTADKKYAEWAKQHTKACPKCKAKIEKNAGCNHMTCVNCHYEFCWLCGGKYSSGHFDKFNVLGCPGMQFSDSEASDSHPHLAMAKRVGVRALIGTGVVVGGLVVGALAIPGVLIGAPIYGGYKLHQRAKRARRGW